MKIDILRLIIELEQAIRINDNAFKPKPIASGTLLLNLDMIYPENGRPNKELIGKTNNRVPNSASFNKNVDFIVGIRDAQVEKLNPERKKKTPKENLCLLKYIMNE